GMPDVSTDTDFVFGILVSQQRGTGLGPNWSTHPTNEYHGDVVITTNAKKPANLLVAI
ncbi:unnamed protein product, partial [marine sediment metagenome]